MKRLPAPKRTAVRKPRRAEVIPAAAPAPVSAVRFSYSVVEVSSEAGTARVRARRASLEDGRLRAESFEGEMGREAFEALASRARHFFAAQAALALAPFMALLPGRRRDD